MARPMPPRPAVYFDDARSGGPHEIVGMLPITFTNGEVEDWWRRLIGAICVTGSLSGERGCFAWNTLRITSPSHSCGCSSVDRGDCGLVVYPHSIYWRPKLGSPIADPWLMPTPTAHIVVADLARHTVPQRRKGGDVRWTD